VRELMHRRESGYKDPPFGLDADVTSLRIIFFYFFKSAIRKELQDFCEADV